MTEEAELQMHTVCVEVKVSVMSRMLYLVTQSESGLYPDIWKS